jgi:hypothetical protein
MQSFSEIKWEEYPSLSCDPFLCFLFIHSSLHQNDHRFEFFYLDDFLVYFWFIEHFLNILELFLLLSSLLDYHGFLLASLKLETQLFSVSYKCFHCKLSVH